MQIKKKYIYIALGLWALVTVTYFTLCKIASDQAMLIFNKTIDLHAAYTFIIKLKEWF